MSESKLSQALHTTVVIVDNEAQGGTGAQAVAPDHSARAVYGAGRLPARGSHAATATNSSTQQRVEAFLYYQAELLDRKEWSAYIALFAQDGMYWMPVTPEQTDWLDAPSIFAEDRLLMEVRRGRVTHPNAWSQAPAWGTSHLLGNVVIESESDVEIVVRSRFMMQELRRDQVRHFAGAYRHTLVKTGDDFEISLQRVDLLSAQAPFDYVLQVWV
jgi:3-phenylpropionate/cinnamic acid dioxygenase small subunit